MKNNPTFYGAVILFSISSMFIVFESKGQKNKDKEDVCAHVGKNLPVAELEVHANKTEWIKTWNKSTTRMIKVIASRKVGNKYKVVGSARIEPGHCFEFDVKSTLDEKWFITYKYKSKIVFYKKFITVVNQDVDECKVTTTSLRLPPLRAGIRGDAGSSGTTTTTVDER